MSGRNEKRRAEDARWFQPDEAGTDEGELSAAELAELASLEADPRLSLVAGVVCELHALDQDGDFARFERAVLDRIDDESLGTTDPADLAELELPAVSAALRGQVRAELDSRDHDWVAFSAAVMKEVQREEKAATERAEVELRQGVAGELGQMERRLAKDFGPEMQRRLSAPRKPRTLRRRAAEWLGDRIEMLGPRRLAASGLGVGALAAALTFLLISRAPSGPDDPLSQAETVDDFNQMKAAWGEPVSVDDLEFDGGTVTVLKGTSDNVTLIWLGDGT